MNEYVTVSSNYQVVIPKNIRRKLGVKPNQKLQVVQTSDGVKFKAPLTAEDVIKKYAGSVKPGDWGDDSAKTISKLRDEWNV